MKKGLGGEVFSFSSGLAAIAGLLVIGDFATTKLRVLFCIDHPRSHFVFHYLRRAEERCPPQAIASSSRRQKRAVTLFCVPLRTARWRCRLELNELRRSKKAGLFRRTADDQGAIFAKRGRPRKR